MLLIISVCLAVLGLLPYGVTTATRITFSRQHYVFVFYDILDKGYTFGSSNFTEKILVTGDAIGSVNFALGDTRYLDIEPVASEKNGEYYARLKVLNTIKAPFRSIFRIIAWDARKVATARVELQIKETYFATFLQPVYYGGVTEDLKVIIYDGAIVLNGGDAKDYHVAVAKEYKDFFDIQFSSEDVELAVRPGQTLETLPKFPINVTLTAYDRYLNKTAETTVVLNGPLLQRPKGIKPLLLW